MRICTCSDGATCQQTERPAVTVDTGAPWQDWLMAGSWWDVATGDRALVSPLGMNLRGCIERFPARAEGLPC